jgi:hypothetical protein
LEHEIPMILEEVHDKIVGGNYAGREIAQNIFSTGIWWLALHKYVKEYYQSCDVCQRVGNTSRRDEMNLNKQATLQAFDKRTIYFVGPINPQERRLEEMYIISSTEYLTR